MVLVNYEAKLKELIQELTNVSPRKHKSLIL